MTVFLLVFLLMLKSFDFWLVFMHWHASSVTYVSVCTFLVWIYTYKKWLFLLMYMYMYMCVWVYVCVCMCRYVYIRMCVNVCTYAYVCMYVYVYVYTVDSRYLDYPLSRTFRYVEQISRSLGHWLGTVDYPVSWTLVISNTFQIPLRVRDKGSLLYVYVYVYVYVCICMCM